MKYFITPSLIALFLTASLAVAAEPDPALANCPDLALEETQDDCPWSAIARKLRLSADLGRPLTPVLMSLAPALVHQISEDSKLSEWKKLWGQSINYDEFAKGIIVHPAILETIGKVFEIAVQASDEKRRVHAGMEHTYGYLFSTLKTPFGYKRARWVRGQIEEGFDLPRGIFSPNTSEGTLFANITYFTGNIAFRNEAKNLKALDKEKNKVAAPVRNFDFSRLTPIRLEEEVDTEDSRKVILRTDLVPFFRKSGTNSHLLIYSVLDSAAVLPQLITAFPVDSAFVDRVTNPKDLGSKPVTTRYNAYIDGVTGANRTGERRIITTSQ